MMGTAEASEKTGLSRTHTQADEFRSVLESATSSILNAEAFRKPYPLIRFRDFFPSDFYARLLQRFPDVDRFAGLNGDGTRREYALYDERSDPGSEESRTLWGIVRRVLASLEVASALRRGSYEELSSPLVLWLTAAAVALSLATLVVIAFA